MTRALQLTLGDFEFAAAELVAATDPEVIRRSLRSALACGYELREHAKRTLGSAIYHDAENDCSEGRTTNALFHVVRSQFTHALEYGASPIVAHIYPGADVFPGPQLILGETLRWAGRDVIEQNAPAVANHPMHANYDDRLAHRPVRFTLEEARLFLIETLGVR